jgi:heme/copper-type cytochrome/quinol oxidase subunit 2
MRLLFGDAIFWIAAVCCLVAQVAIVRSTLRPYTPAPENAQVPRPRTAVEVAWVLLPAVALIGVFALTWQAMHQPAEPTGVVISGNAPALPTQKPAP